MIMDGENASITLDITAYSGNNVNYTHMCILDKRVSFCSIVNHLFHIHMKLLVNVAICC